MALFAVPSSDFPFRPPREELTQAEPFAVALGKIKVRPGLQQGLKKREADHQVSSLDPGGADAAVPVEAVAQMHCVSGCGLPVPTDRPERKKMARSD